MKIKSAKIITAGITAALAISLAGCSPSVEDEIIKPEFGETKLSYNTATVEYMTIQTEEKIPAKLAFAETTEFKAPFDTKIKKINTSKNKFVKKGDVLFELDTTDLDFQISEQTIKVAQSSNSIDKEYAQIELDKLKAEREKASIVAPYDGIVNNCSFLQEGNAVKADDTLCSVSVPSSVYVYNNSGGGKNLRFNMDVKLKINNVDYSGTVIAAPDTAPDDAKTATLNFSAVKLTDEDLDKFLNEENGAVDAESGWATIFAVTVKRTNVLAVPASAIKSEIASNYCSILRGEEKYDMPVEIGVTAGDYTEIISGINEGDVVILSDGKSNTANKNNNNNNNNNGGGNNDRGDWQDRPQEKPQE